MLKLTAFDSPKKSLVRMCFRLGKYDLYCTCASDAKSRTFEQNRVKLCVGTNHDLKTNSSVHFFNTTCITNILVDDKRHGVSSQGMLAALRNEFQNVRFVILHTADYRNNTPQ